MAVECSCSHLWKLQQNSQNIMWGFESNSHVKKKMGLRKSHTCVHTYITSKRIELESPGCTGLEENSKCFKTWPTGTF